MPIMKMMHLSKGGYGKSSEAWCEKNISYDSNGNILSLTRTGADGNMTFDGRMGMSLTWNDLGLVEKSPWTARIW